MPVAVARARRAHLDHLLDGKAVGDHQPCSPQSTQTGEQFKPVICRCAGNSCRSRASPHGHVPAAWRSSPPRQTTAWLAIYPCGQLPLGPGGFGTGKGSASAVVVTSASLREKLIFIGSIAVWDTIGTLPPSGIEIVTLFRFVDCCVMGRKAPRKRLARRVMACPRVPRTHPNVSRRSAHPSIRVGEARLQTPDADMRRGNEKGCLTS